MLMELVMQLVSAADPSDKERAYRSIERSGVDRGTADAMAEDFRKGGTCSG